MSTPDELRASLKAFLAQHLRLDAWGIDLPANVENPAKPPSVALDEPAKFDTDQGFLSETAPVRLPATFGFQILYRFGAEMRYNQLPRGILESKLVWLRTLFRLCANCDINEEIDPSSIRTSSSVAIARQQNKEWILVCKISFSFDTLFEVGELNVTSTQFDP
jgi:hypothetical protein